MSKAGDRLYRQMTDGPDDVLPALEIWQEYRFHPVRKWRFDFAWPARKLAVEVDGGTFAQGRHTRGKGYQADCDKLNSAAILGWRVLRVTTDDVNSGKAIELVKALVIGESEKDSKATPW